MIDTLNILLDNWETVQRIYDEEGHHQSAYQRLVSEVPGFDQVPYPMFLPYFEAIQATRENDMQAMTVLRQENARLKEDLEQVRYERDELLALMHNPNNPRIGRWTISKSKEGVYRAFRRVNSRLFGIHLGRELDMDKARKRVREREKNQDFQEALAKSRLPS